MNLHILTRFILFISLHPHLIDTYNISVYNTFRRLLSQFKSMPICKAAAASADLK